MPSYQVAFHAICEECGRPFDGLVAQRPSVTNAASDMWDAPTRRKFLEHAVRNRRWSSLDTRYGPDGHGCPHCGARQSWDPLPKPEEPTRAVRGKVAVMGCFLFAAFIVGGTVALSEYLVQILALGEDDPLVMFVAWAACLVVGVVLAMRYNKEEDRLAGGIYKERVRTYELQLAAYEDYQAMEGIMRYMLNSVKLVAEE